MEEIKKMKFSVLTEKGHAEVRERNLPEMGSDDVLVKQLACNICTTDYGQWLGLREHQGYPMAGGHEESGIVMAIGEDVKDLKPREIMWQLPMIPAENAKPAGEDRKACVPERIIRIFQKTDTGENLVSQITTCVRQERW